MAIDEQAIWAPPFPPLFCAVDSETCLGVLEFLVKTYPEALCTSDISSVTPLDIALKENLPLAVISLFVQYYPISELKVSEKGGSTILKPEVACILGCNHNTVRTIVASFIRFTTSAQTAFFEVLAWNKTLTKIILKLVELDVDRKVCNAFHFFLTTNATIKKMSVFGGILNESLADSMVNGIQSNCTITDLVIEGGLSWGSVESLLAGSLSITNVEKLSLKYTVAHGADWSGLSSFIFLQSLNLSNCQVGESLAIPLAVLLEETKSLEELFVGRNYIGDDGTVAIAKALQLNSSLRKLEYEKNNIGEPGWEALTDAMREFNTTLRFVPFATEDLFYEKHFPQLIYFCDQNGLGRRIPLAETFRANIGEDNVTPLPTGESTSESLELHTI